MPQDPKCLFQVPCRYIDPSLAADTIGKLVSEDRVPEQSWRDCESAYSCLLRGKPEAGRSLILAARPWRRRWELLKTREDLEKREPRSLHATDQREERCSFAFDPQPFQSASVTIWGKLLANRLYSKESLSRMQLWSSRVKSSLHTWLLWLLTYFPTGCLQQTQGFMLEKIWTIALRLLSRSTLTLWFALESSFSLGSLTRLQM